MSGWAHEALVTSRYLIEIRLFPSLSLFLPFSLSSSLSHNLILSSLLFPSTLYLSKSSVGHWCRRNCLTLEVPKVKGIFVGVHPLQPLFLEQP